MRRIWRSAVCLLLGCLPALSALAESRGTAPPGGGLATGFSLGQRKDPLSVVADSLELDYRGRVLTYRGHVRAEQGDLRLEADTVTVTLPGDGETGVEEVIARGNVRLFQGDRHATGGEARFDQRQRTAILQDGAVLHDGPNRISGERVIVYLDEQRSVVEGASDSRVRAVLYPKTLDEPVSPGGSPTPAEAP